MAETVGPGTLFAQCRLRERLIGAGTIELHLTGSWADPQVQHIDRSAVNPTEKRPPG